MPGWIFYSVFTSTGIVALPVILVFAFAFVRCEWPLRTVVICTVLMWVNIHNAVRWGNYDSPMAKKMQMLRDINTKH